LVTSARLEQESRGAESGIGVAAWQGHLFADGRHVRPGIEDVGSFMPLEHGKVIRLQKILVPNLDSIRPASWKIAQEYIEISDEVPATCIVAWIKLREFEEQYTDVPTKGFARC